jgi:hypothetical protein
MADTSIDQLGQFEAFRAYWDRLQQEAGGVPTRQQLNPNEIRELLPYVFLIERRAYDDLHVRLSGTALDAVGPTPPTGTNYLDICAPDDRAAYAAIAEKILTHPCGHVLRRAVTFTDGKTQELTSLMLPMKDRHGDMRYLIGVVSVKADYLAAEPAPEAFVSIRPIFMEFLDIGFGLPAED